MNKEQLRNQIKEKLQDIPSAVYHDWSNAIAAKLFSLAEWKTANTIAFTISRGKEVDTKTMIEEGWKQGKRIVVPKCEPTTKGMTFRAIESYEQLEIVYYGLKEPKESETKAVNRNEIDLMIVPGLAYSKKGYRVGFGGGYYDRFLQNYNGTTASLAFALQLVDELPVEEHDLAVDMIITNEQVVRCQ